MIHFTLCIVIVATLPVSAASGSDRQSSVEGMLVDWNNTPVAEVKITAVQADCLVSGYEQFETVTDAEGKFRLEGLFPTWKYVLKPWSDKWQTDASMEIETAPRGETEVLRQPMVIESAYLRSDGSRIGNLITFGPRFSASAEGVISDAATNLEWMVGPEEEMTYREAVEWLATCDVAGGGWRMPFWTELTDFRPRSQDIDPKFLHGTGRWLVWTKSERGGPFGMSHGYHSGDKNTNRRTGRSQRSDDRNYVFGVRPRQEDR